MVRLLSEERYDVNRTGAEARLQAKLAKLPPIELAEGGNEFLDVLATADPDAVNLSRRWGQLLQARVRGAAAILSPQGAVNQFARETLVEASCGNVNMARAHVAANVLHQASWEHGSALLDWVVRSMMPVQQ